MTEPIRTVLLVAPDTGLEFGQEEVQDILRSGLNVTPLLGDVTQVELTREIARGRYDALWLVTHGSTDGVQLGSRHIAVTQINAPPIPDLLDISALTALVRGRFRLVVLNSCSSLAAAQMLQNEAAVDVICTIVDAPDQDAYRTGALFAHRLAETGDPRRAYAQSRPGGNRLYIYLAAVPDFLARRLMILESPAL